MATKERHKSRGKRLKSLIKCEQGGFCTHRVSDEDGDKIHELISQFLHESGSAEKKKEVVHG